MIHGIGVPVPETYRLPLPTAKQLWDMWFFGLRIKWEDRDRKIRPLRWFKQYNLKNKSDQKLLCKGRRVFITKLLDLAVTIGAIINAESVNQMNCNQSTTIFDAAFVYNLIACCLLLKLHILVRRLSAWVIEELVNYSI
jgi:hypothetical protein